MSVKQFLEKPENLLNLSFVLMVLAQIGNVVQSLIDGRVAFLSIQLALLVGVIVTTLVHFRTCRHHPYPVSLQAARTIFLSFLFLALLSLR